MNEFTKEELDNIELLLKSDNISNYIIAFNLLRINWKLSEVKRFVVRWFLRNRVVLGGGRATWEFGRWNKTKVMNYNKEKNIREVINNKYWEVGWYAKPLIKELYNFEIEGIRHFMLGGKYCNK